MAGVTLEEAAVAFLLLIFGYFVGRWDAGDMVHQAHMAVFWVGFENGYDTCKQEIEDSVDNSDSL